MEKPDENFALDGLLSPFLGEDTEKTSSEKGSPTPRSDCFTEDFDEFAWAEIADCPYWEPGVCFRPDCSARFTPISPSHKYCCKSCQRADLAEFRKWGNRLAKACLVWVLGKHAKTPEERELTRMARRHVTRLQAEWRDSRKERRACSDGSKITKEGQSDG